MAAIVGGVVRPGARGRTLRRRRWRTAPRPPYRGPSQEHRTTALACRSAEPNGRPRGLLCSLRSSHYFQRVWSPGVGAVAGSLGAAGAHRGRQGGDGPLWACHRRQGRRRVGRRPMTSCSIWVDGDRRGIDAVKSFCQCICSRTRYQTAHCEPDRRSHRRRPVRVHRGLFVSADCPLVIGWGAHDSSGYGDAARISDKTTDVHTDLRGAGGRRGWRRVRHDQPGSRPHGGHHRGRRGTAPPPCAASSPREVNAVIADLLDDQGRHLAEALGGAARSPSWTSLTKARWPPPSTWPWRSSAGSMRCSTTSASSERSIHRPPRQVDHTPAAIVRAL